MRRAVLFALPLALLACSSSDGSSTADAGDDTTGFVCDYTTAPTGACRASDPTCYVKTPDHCYETCSCVDGTWRCDDATCVSLPDGGDAADVGGDASEAGDGDANAETDAGPAKDKFGVREIYPTTSGGREWFLPPDPTKSDGEWIPPSSSEIAAGPVAGSATISGSPRIDVVSPKGEPWWRNVEMTGYIKYESIKTTDPSQAPHWTFYARGERHTSSTTVADPKTIDLGVLAPAGTATWPGYPFTGMTSIDARCLGSSIKGAVYPDGHLWWKKEISHTEGYTASRPPPDGVVAVKSGLQKDWFGYKVVIRNRDHDTHVHMESWLDADASGGWTKVLDVDDTGGWTAGTPTIDGCGAAPFSYATDQLITWAGPYVTFRVDNLVYDLKWASAREITALP